MIKTYTNEGELVLDNCIGSGSTAVAAINTNRNFIGFETDAHYFAVMFENQQRDGSTRFVKLLKGKFKEPSDTSKTKTDSPEFSTPTIEATFINRTHDKLWKKVAVTSNETFKGADKWYTSVEEEGDN